MDITVCVPTIAPRTKLLARAIESVGAQEYLPWAINVAYDHAHEGHGLTRNRAIESATTEWLAFLDDDDEMYPNHLQLLMERALETDADVVYPWFDVIGGGDPFPQFEGKPWDPEAPHIFPVTVLIRRSTILDVGGFVGYRGENAISGNDYQTWLKIFASGARVAHLPERTWAWHHDSNNTSGQGWNW